MIVPELKSLSSVELDRSCVPTDPRDCCVVLDASIGPKGESASDMFSFSLVTPSYIAKDALPRWGRGALIVEEFSWQIAEQAIQTLLLRCVRNSWVEVAKSLNQELIWEYDNFQPPTA